MIKPPNRRARFYLHRKGVNAIDFQWKCRQAYYALAAIVLLLLNAYLPIATDIFIKMAIAMLVDWFGNTSIYIDDRVSNYYQLAP